MPTETRIFYAHSKAQADFLREDADIIAARWAAKTGAPARVTTGREDHDQHFAAAGRNWDKWADRWAFGTRLGGEPHYHIAVVPTVTIGRPTARGIAAMLAVGKTVIYWDRADLWARVERIIITNERSYTAHAEIVYTEPTRCAAAVGSTPPAGAALPAWDDSDVPF